MELESGEMLKRVKKNYFDVAGMTKERDAGLKILIFVLTSVLSKIVSSLSMTYHTIS
jgi:hypothetical protein